AAQRDDLTHMTPSSPFSQFLEFGTLPNRAIITHTHTCRIHGEGAVSGSAEQTVQGDEYTRTQSDQSRGEHEHEHHHGTDHRRPVRAQTRTYLARGRFRAAARARARHGTDPKSTHPDSTPRSTSYA